MSAQSITSAQTRAGNVYKQGCYNVKILAGHGISWTNSNGTPGSGSIPEIAAGDQDYIAAFQAVIDSYETPVSTDSQGNATQTVRRDSAVTASVKGPNWFLILIGTFLAGKLFKWW